MGTILFTTYFWEYKGVSRNRITYKVELIYFLESDARCGLTYTTSVVRNGVLCDI